nr:Hypothetical protein CBG19124 [Haemonchus contortus]
MNDSMATANFNETQGPCDVDTHPYLRLAFVSFGSVISIVGCACNLLLLLLFLSKQWLYTVVKDNNVVMLIASRIVQLCIPYTLIANTAFRLASITQRSQRFTRSRNLQIVVLAIAIIAMVLRVPGYFFMEVMELPECDFFESRVLTGKTMDPVVTNLYRISDVFIQFLHLFVSFIILCVLNCVVIQKLRTSHDRAKRRASCQSLSLTTKPNTLGDEEEQRERKALRCAVKTTIVIISSYLACNSVNFILYCIEMFNTSLIQDDDGYFNVFYVVAGDIRTILNEHRELERITKTGLIKAEKLEASLAAG